MKRYLILLILLIGYKVSYCQLNHFLIGIYSYDYDTSLTNHLGYFPSGTDPFVGNDIEFLRQLKNSNFNCIQIEKQLIGFYTSQPPRYAIDNPSKAFLDRADSLNIKIILTCPDLSIGWYSPSYNSVNSINGLNYYGTHSALLGFSVKDEPKKNNFKDINLYFSDINNFDSTILRFSNLLPIYAGKNALGYSSATSDIQAYELYIQDFIDSCGPNILSFDSYPIWNCQNSTTDTDYIYWPNYWTNDFFYNLDIISRKSVENNLPFIYVLTPFFKTTSQQTLLKNKYEFNYVIYSALLYGAKGIQYWHAGVFYKSCWFSVDEEVKEYLKDLHKKFTEKEQILLSLKFQGAYHYSNFSTIKPGYTEKIPSYSNWSNFNDNIYANEIFNLSDPIQSNSSIDSIVISFLIDDFSNRYFWIFNKSMTSAQTLQLNLSDSCSVYNIFGDETCPISNNITVSLEPGEAKLYRVFFVNDTIDISQTKTWCENKVVTNEIIIHPSGTLTISDTVRFDKRASIIIKPGGKLVLDGGTLTNACDNDTWQGIQILGNSSVSQLTSGAQGIVELRNGAVISNAVCGIKVWDGTNPNSSGGIVRAANASFINNATAVEFGEYHNINNGYELGNRSYFTNCIFTINNDYLTSNERFRAHVKLNSIKNVRFAGCTFSNERNILPSVLAEIPIANMGILAFNSGFSVKPSCNVSGVYPCPPEQQNRSSFNGFSHGIYVSGSEGNYTVNIDQTDFDNNVIGINLSATTNASVLRSQFNIGYADFLPKQTGIIASNSTGFRFEENQFAGNTEFLGTSVGIKIRNSGGNSNQTYKNDFSNLTIGEEFIGKNRSKRDLFIGLQALCNNHTDITQSDILVEMNQNGTRDGIRYYQGERDEGTMLYILSAGNLFSNSATTNYDNNTMQYIDYQYSANDPREMPTVNNMVNLDFPAVSNSCLSRIDALTLSQISQQYSAARNSYISLLYNYNQQIDGGNTEQLLDDIQGEWSDDVWKIRQELLAKSPYVSQEVLKETAKKNLLPQAIYLEICLANVDATRSQEFLDFLRYEIPNPLPEYMLDVVRENWDTKSLRTVLESNLAHYSSKKDYLLDMMLNNSLKDSITNRTYVRSMLTERGYYSDYFTIAEGYIEENDFENAYNTMYDLSLNYYKLTEEQQTEINDFEEYIAFRENLFVSDSSNIYQLTASEIENLIDYTKSHTGRGRILAQNILCVLYDICEEEELIENKDHFTPNSNTYSSAKMTSDQIEVMPNPAQNYTTFKWDFDLLQGNALLKIYEQSGKQIETQVLSSAQGQWVWDTRSVSDGIYTYSVTSNSMLIESGKVIVKK